MAKQIKFTIGNEESGYKSVEIGFAGGKVSYQILRSGLLDVGKKISHAVKISDTWLAELNALNIFSWQENYSSQVRGGLQWTLLFQEGTKIYRGRGENAYPENFSKFLDWLDVIVPELEFVNRKRLERVTLEYLYERLTLDRRDKTLTLDKKNSAHTYDAEDNIEEIFDACKKMIDGIETTEENLIPGSHASLEVVCHDGSTEIFNTIYNENFLPGLMDFIDETQKVIDDLRSDIFTPPTAEIAPRQGKYILCKVQFKGSYKHYTYRADDETLAVGDIVDVPVGRDNEIRQAKLVEIGYFDEYEAPFPIERIKKIIGKHIGNEWENF